MAQISLVMILKSTLKSTYWFACSLFLMILPLNITAENLLFNPTSDSSQRQSTSDTPSLNKHQALLFPSSFLHRNLINDNSGEQSSLQLLENIRKIKYEYLETLNDTSAFPGIYINGGYSKDLTNDTNEYYYGLEWEFFDNGHHAAVRKLEKRKLETRLHFLQQLRQMYAQHKESQLSFLKQIEDRLQLHIAEIQSEIIFPQLKKATQQLKRGYITQIEYQEWKLRAFKVRSQLNYLRSKNLPGLTRQQFDFLNHLEQQAVKGPESLFKTAKEQSIAIQVQVLFNSRSKFLPTWEDNLSLSLFLEQHHRNTQTSDDMVGIRLRIPLGMDSNREKLIGFDKKIYQDQIVAIKKHIQQRLHNLNNQFLFHQERVKYLSQEYNLLNKKIATLKIQKSAGLPSLKHTPEKNIPFQKLNRIEVLHNALLARLKLYTTAIEIEELVMPDQLMDLFE